MTYEEACNAIPNGYYNHYMGGLYKVIYIAEHSETGEAMVIYQDGNNKIWARPADMWYERIGRKRFEKINFRLSKEELENFFGKAKELTQYSNKCSESNKYSESDKCSE